MSNVVAVRTERVQLKDELKTLEAEMESYLKELGYDAQGSASAAGGRMPGAAGAGGDA